MLSFLCDMSLAVVTLLLSVMSVLADHEGGDPLQWLRDSVPGEPGLGCVGGQTGRDHLDVKINQAVILASLLSP